MTGDATSAALNVYQRMNIAKKAVATANFKKVQTQGLKYAYLPIESIKPIVEDALNDAGLVVVYDHFRYEHAREPWDAVAHNPYGDTVSRWFHLAGSIDIIIVNMDDPRDRITYNFSGEGKDNSDKALSKLYTAIIKNAYKAIFNISESKDDDADNTAREVEHEKAQIKAARQHDPFFDGPQKKPAEKTPAKVYKDEPVPPRSEVRVKAEAVAKAARTGPGREALTPLTEKHGLTPAMLKNADAMEQQPAEVLAECYAAIEGASQ